MSDKKKPIGPAAIGQEGSGQYARFLQRKTDHGIEHGFEPLFMPGFLFDFQHALVDWAVRLGRCGIFADCGMGKTPMQLVWAENVLRKTNKAVLILTPLAVSSQTLGEAEKFGIEAHRAEPGKGKTIIQVTNYERLHHFDAGDYAGVVCDECFVGDTLVDTPQGSRRIEDICPGDKVFTALGTQKVKAVRTRVRNTLALTSIQGRDILSSKNHPFLTYRGWVRAKDLMEGDRVVYTKDAMRMVRDALDGKAAKNGESLLRTILLGEMENEPTRDQGQGAHEGSTCTNRQEGVRMAALRRSQGDSPDRDDPQLESNRTPRDQGKDFSHPQGNGAQAKNTGGEWEPNARPATEIARSPGQRMGSRICPEPRPETARVSDLLQDRHSQCEDEGCHRSGWIQPCSNETTSARCQERGEIAGARVDRVAIYQSGGHGFLRYRDESGRFVLYDLEVEGHPSYSVQGLLVHNSSILKNFDGQRKAAITEFMRRVPYRLLCTATAAPNDWVELGTSSEALGYLGYVDMLTRFFTNKQGSIALSRGRFQRDKWILKGHAEEPFWKWVASWARAARSPSDLGFDDDGFILPPLNEEHTRVRAYHPAQGMLFDLPAVTFHEEREVTRRTIQERCEAAAERIAQHDVSMAWCHLNDEAKILKGLIPDAVEISGSDSDEKKEEAAHWFVHGQEERRTLISKPRIFGFGLNFQHCAHMTYFPTHSYEQYYQATRRLWRFGQTRPVTVDLIYTDGGERMMDNLARKAQAADRMFVDLVKHMNQSMGIVTDYSTIKVEVPAWMTSK